MTQSGTLEQRMELFGKYLDRTGMEHKDYQFDGVRWCLANELSCAPLYGVRGGFIADEMGLGKTIMMIGLMVCNFVRRTLIVLPPVLIDQWVLQIYRTTGHRALVYHGANKKQVTLDDMKKAIIVITSYGTVSYKKKIKGADSSSGLKYEKNMLFDVKWSRIVYDEAHHLRNKNTELYERASLLKSRTRWFVSGTPIQNSAKDFYNICALLGLPSSVYMNFEGLEIIKKHFILKRTKKEVGIWMPELSVQKEVVPWKNSKDLDLSEKITTSIHTCEPEYRLLLLMLAKQSCIMPELLVKHLRFLVRQGFVENNSDVREAMRCSSKVDKAVQEILERKGNGCGKLVFCHFYREMDEITQRLREGGMEVAVFDGRTTSRLKRQELLTGRTEVIILQIQTGCEGLNLQENYSEIYFVSPHWNPAVEEQAIARCHRIGQTKPVLVKRFVMGDFDESLAMDNRVISVQDKKKEIVYQTLD